jgi:hypothetical protein
MITVFNKDDQAAPSQVSSGPSLPFFPAITVDSYEDVLMIWRPSSQRRDPSRFPAVPVYYSDVTAIEQNNRRWRGDRMCNPNIAERPRPRI